MLLDEGHERRVRMKRDVRGRMRRGEHTVQESRKRLTKRRVYLYLSNRSIREYPCFRSLPRPYRVRLDLRNSMFFSNGTNSFRVLLLNRLTKPRQIGRRIKAISTWRTSAAARARMNVEPNVERAVTRLSEETRNRSSVKCETVE